MSERDYLPALRFRTLTAVYDPLIRWTTREATFRPKLLDQAALRPGQQVLDLGCGTGTLALMAKKQASGIEVTGLDADAEMLDQARRKATRAAIEIRFDEGLADELPYGDASFDRVLSTLFFHHLTGEAKRRTIEEIARVLRPGGELHVADWGRPADPLMAALFLQIRLFDGWEETRANVSGNLPILFKQAGLGRAEERSRLRTPFGTLSLYSAQSEKR